MTKLRFNNGPLEGQEIDPCSICGCEVVAAPVQFNNYGPRYWVSTTGRVFSIERRIWSALDADGQYLRAKFYPKVGQWSIVVHKLVALTFPNRIPEWDGSAILEDYTIDHHDKNKRHNCVTNLRVIKGGQTDLGYKKGERVSKLGDHRKEILFYIREGSSVGQIAERFKVSENAVRNRIRQWENDSF